ncbi:MAG TPA: hypothetical protein VIM90_08835 [Arenimonas sp.]
MWWMQVKRAGLILAILIATGCSTAPESAGDSLERFYPNGKDAADGMSAEIDWVSGHVRVAGERTAFDRVGPEGCFKSVILTYCYRAGSDSWDIGDARFWKDGYRSIINRGGEERVEVIASEQNGLQISFLRSRDGELMGWIYQMPNEPDDAYLREGLSLE